MLRAQGATVAITGRSAETSRLTQERSVTASTGGRSFRNTGGSGSPDTTSAFFSSLMMDRTSNPAKGSSNCTCRKVGEPVVCSVGATPETRDVDVCPVLRTREAGHFENDLADVTREVGHFESSLRRVNIDRSEAKLE